MASLELIKTALKPVALPLLHARHGVLGRYMTQARLVSGWTTPAELKALAGAVAALPGDPVIVELGSFLGRSAILLGGACVLRGSGQVHCVDGFDAGGDAASVGVYQRKQSRLQRSLLEQFRHNTSRAGVSSRLTIHQGDAPAIGHAWSGSPVDMLFIDADQSRIGARAAYDAWFPHLRAGGILALHNSTRDLTNPDHDGIALLRQEEVKPPQFGDIREVGSTTFAVKLAC